MVCLFFLIFFCSKIQYHLSQTPCFCFILVTLNEFVEQISLFSFAVFTSSLFRLILHVIHLCSSFSFVALSSLSLCLTFQYHFKFILSFLLSLTSNWFSFTWPQIISIIIFTANVCVIEIVVWFACSLCCIYFLLSLYLLLFSLPPLFSPLLALSLFRLSRTHNRTPFLLIPIFCYNIFVMTFQLTLAKKFSSLAWLTFQWIIIVDMCCIYVNKMKTKETKIVRVNEKENNI